MARQYVGVPETDSWLITRAFSSAVVSHGGKTIWLAGHVGTSTDDGKKLIGDFEAQVRQTFHNLEATLKRVGGSLKDIVTMTVYVLDVRYGDRFVQLRREIFKKDFPCSALITVAGFANPDIMVEIVPVAVIGEL
jgi:enamine deaminase RidA (YjgF/YER057c/UK114 family)